MARKRKLRSSSNYHKKLKNPLYLNANIVYSEAYCRVNRRPNSTLKKLSEEGYTLVVSTLVRFEIVKNLRNNYGMTHFQSRRLYFEILNDYSIVELNVENHVSLNEAYIDKLSKTEVSFKDAIHLDIARSAKMLVCSHDTKMKKGTNYDDKKKYYSEVYKAQDLIKPKEK